MLAEQKMTSDGITSESLLAIYRAMYHRFDVLREKLWVRLLPSRSLTAVNTRWITPTNSKRVIISITARNLQGGRGDLCHRLSIGDA